MFENTPLRTKQIRLDTGDRYPLTVSAEGIPVWWPNLYCSVELHQTGLAYPTMVAQMNAICLLHNICVSRNIDLDQRIGTVTLFSPEEINLLRDQLRRTCRNGMPSDGITSVAVVGNAHWRDRLKAIAKYIVWRCEPVLDRMGLSDQRLPEARHRLEHFPEKLVGTIRVRRNTNKEGLDEVAQKAFLDAITPGHPTNPFRPRNQIRNQALWMIYWDAGLRRGGALLMSGHDLRLSGSSPSVFVARRPNDPEDPRSVEPRNKTSAHQASIGPDTTRLLHNFVNYERRKYPGAKKSKFVFLSQKGKSNGKAHPLSPSTVDKMYRRLRDLVPGLPADFTTHVLRRTHKDRMGDAAEEVGLAFDMERLVINQESGWTATSDSLFEYQRRRLRKKGNKLSVLMQDRTKVMRGDE